MTALPIIADTYRVALKWTATSGQTAVNVMHFFKAGSSPALLFAAIDANVTAAMWHAVSSTATVTQVQITPLDGSSATSTFASSGAKWTGGTGADFSPASSVVVSLRTLHRGRSHRGRSFLPFVAEAAMANGSLLAAEITTSQPAWTTWLAAMATAGFPLQVASYKLATTEGVNTVLFEPTLGTQRRRQTRLRV